MATDKLVTVRNQIDTIHSGRFHETFAIASVTPAYILPNYFVLPKLPLSISNRNSVRPSVHLSNTRVLCDETNGHIAVRYIDTL